MKQRRIENQPQQNQPKRDIRSNLQQINIYQKDQFSLTNEQNQQNNLKQNKKDSLQDLNKSRERNSKNNTIESKNKKKDSSHQKKQAKENESEYFRNFNDDQYLNQLDNLIKQNIVRQNDSYKRNELQNNVKKQIEEIQQAKNQLNALANQIDDRSYQQIKSRQGTNEKNYTSSTFNQGNKQGRSDTFQRKQQKNSPENKLNELYNIQRLYPNSSKLIDQKKKKQESNKSKAGKKLKTGTPNIKEEIRQMHECSAKKREEERIILERKQKVKQQQWLLEMKEKIKQLEKIKNKSQNKGRKIPSQPSEQYSYQKYDSPNKQQNQVNSRKNILEQLEQEKCQVFQMKQEQDTYQIKQRLQNSSKELDKQKQKQKIKEDYLKSLERKQKIKQQKKEEEQLRQYEDKQYLQQTKNEQQNKLETYKIQEKEKKRKEYEQILQKQRELEEKKEQIKQKYLEQKRKQDEINKKISELKNLPNQKKAQSKQQSKIRKNYNELSSNNVQLLQQNTKLEKEQKPSRLDIALQKMPPKSNKSKQKSSKKPVKPSKQKSSEKIKNDQFNIEDLQPEQLKELLKNKEFKQVLQKEGYDVDELIKYVEQQQQQKEIDIDQMDPQQLYDSLQNEQFVQALQEQGYDVEQIKLALQQQLQSENKDEKEIQAQEFQELEQKIQNMSPKEILDNMKDENFLNNLRKTGIDVEELRQEIQKQIDQDDQDKDKIQEEFNNLDLQNMSSTELLEKLQNPQFKQFLIKQGINVEEIEQDIKQDLINQNNSGQEEQDIDLDLNDMTPEQLKLKLQDEQFCQLLQEKGIDAEELKQQLEKNEQGFEEDLQNMNPQELLEKLKNQDFQDIVKSYGIDVDYLIQSLNQQIQEQEQYKSDIEKMDPSELRQQMKNKEFIDMLEQQGIDTQLLQQQLDEQLNEKEQEEEEEIDLMSMTPQDIKQKLSDPAFRQQLQKKQIDVKELESQLDHQLEQERKQQQQELKKQEQKKQQNQKLKQILIQLEINQENYEKLKSDDLEKLFLTKFSENQIIELKNEQLLSSEFKRKNINLEQLLSKIRQQKELKEQKERKEQKQLLEQKQQQEQKEKKEKEQKELKELKEKEQKEKEKQNKQKDQIKPQGAQYQSNDDLYDQWDMNLELNNKVSKNFQNDKKNSQSKPEEGIIDLQNMDLQQLKLKLQDKQFRAQLIKEGVDINQIEQELNQIPDFEEEVQQYENIDVENMDIFELKQKLSDQNFRKQLELQGYDVQDLENQLMTELQNIHEQIDLTILENMQPEELKLKLGDNQFRSQLELQGIDVNELEQQLDERLQEQFNIKQTEDKKKEKNVDSQNKSPHFDQNQKENNEQQLDNKENSEEELDLENMDTEELRQRLKQPKFRQKLELLGVDIEDLEQQLEVQNQEENQDIDMENLNPLEIKEGNKDYINDNIDQNKQLNQQDKQYKETLQKKQIDSSDLLIQDHLVKTAQVDTDENQKQLEIENIPSNDNQLSEDILQQLQDMTPLELKEKLQDKNYVKILQSNGIDVEDLLAHLEQYQKVDETFDVESMNVKQLQELLQNEESKQLLVQQGYQLEELQNLLNQKIDEQNQIISDLMKLDPQELNEQLQNQELRQALVQQGIDVDSLLKQLETQQQFDLENISQEELKANLQNEEFRNMLEQQGYNVEDIIKQISGLQNEEQEAPIDLENMDIDELKQNLQDQKFLEKIQQQGYDVQDILQQVFGDQEQQEQDQNNIQPEIKDSKPEIEIEDLGNIPSEEMILESSFKEDQQKGSDIKEENQNQNEQPEGDIIDLQNMDIEELKQNLQNEEFKQLLNKQGYDVDDIINQVFGEDQQVQEQEQANQVLDLKDMDIEQLKLGLQNEEFVQGLIQQGYDVEQLMKQVFGDQGEQQGVEQNQLIDLENMDPEELKNNLQNEDFQKMLIEQGYDVQDIIKQVIGDEDLQDDALIDLQNMDIDELKKNLQDPQFIKNLEKQGWDVQNIIDQLNGGESKSDPEQQKQSLNSQKQPQFDSPINLQEMDPEELLENLKNPEFQQLLQNQGIDVEDLVSQIEQEALKSD